jgi:hypothetical protein
MNTEQQIDRLDGRIDKVEARIDRLEQHLDLKLDAITATLMEHSKQLGELNGRVTTGFLILGLGIPASVAFATAILGWILTHSKFIG